MNHEPSKYLVDGVSLGVAVGALVNWLPAIATALSIVWSCIRIYETQTVQRWLGRKDPGRTAE